MHNAVKNLAKETIIYTISDIVVRGCSYIVLLLQTGILTPGEYGIITEFYGSYIAFGSIVYLFSMDIAYFRFLHKLGKECTFNTILTVLLITTAVCSIILVLCIPVIAKITNHISHVRYFYYVVAILILDTFITIFYAVLRAEQKPIKFTIAKSLQAIINIIFSCILLYVPSSIGFIKHLLFKYCGITVYMNALDAIFITNLLSNVSALAILFPQYKSFRFSYNKKVYSAILGYALASFFTTLFLRLNDILPITLFRQLIPTDFYETYTKEEILGNLGTSYKLTLLIRLGIQAFKYAAEPFFFSNSDKKDAKKLYGQTMHLFILISCVALLLFSLNIDWIAKILIPKAYYRNTVDIVPYLAFVHILLGVYYNFSIAFKLSNKPQYSTWISALGCLIVLATSWLLMPILGHWGGTYASIVGTAAMTLLGYFISKKLYPIPYYKHGFLVLLITFYLLDKVAAWPFKLTFLDLGWAYVLLNILIIAIFYAIAMFSYKYVHSFRK
ncbi:lipopolysaccharide biosynthesis protein [Cardinium endosymbiont of Culicoides punctatus]|uniref:lipopolysaccharide biosynthesis protein n=1 Tax=Cardinium endosymbiont of Culicoides punctatus TaxID=2304601 RepID=UPI001058CC46|nr:polysaccharide biosynthesis C-terminal domain-containing protein [Cardinium endosymbiont of Culicoides punctatus]TDG95432.1 hypothetical protein CCPUN_04080 [Cardinium endosymbiont of Culicoides punctatus]